MKRAMILVWSVAVAALLSSCGAARFQYACIALDRTPGRVLAAGEGNPEACRALFGPPGPYIGPQIDIPHSATVQGVLVVSRGGQFAALPISTWTTESGEVRFGCNGPTPQFARQGKTLEDCVAAIQQFIAPGSASTLGSKPSN